MAGSYSSLKVADLRAELQKRGLNATGTKTEMIEKLKADDASKSQTEKEVAAEPAKPVESVTAPATEPIQPAATPATSEPLPKSEDAAETTADSKTEPNPTSTSSESATTNTTTETAKEKETTSADTPAKVAEPSLEELKASVLEELAKQLKRVARFGNNTEKEKEIQTTIQRINKLGLSDRSQAYKILGTGQKPKTHSRNGNNNQRHGNHRIHKNNSVRR